MCCLLRGVVQDAALSGPGDFVLSFFEVGEGAWGGVFEVFCVDVGVYCYWVSVAVFDCLVCGFEVAYQVGVDEGAFQL